MKRRLLIANVVVVALALSVGPATATTTCTTLINAVIQDDGSVVANANEFEIAGCSIDATGLTYAIYAGGYSGTIHNNTIGSSIYGSGGFVSILVGAASFSSGKHVNIYENTIQGYRKGGLSNGFFSLGGLYGIDAAVWGNTVTGPGLVDVVTYGSSTPNGIQFGRFATGQIYDNVVSGNVSNNDIWTSAGILLFNVVRNEVKTRHNILAGNQAGFLVLTEQSCEAQGWGPFCL